MNNPKHKKSQAQTFRAGVGAIILNKDGLVLGLERKDIPDAWQMPQGGLDEGETLLDAVKREILEETGIRDQNLELLATFPHWLAYELPEEARTKKIGRGQAQRWFLFRFTGPDEAITLGDGKEFRTWKWTTMEELKTEVASFKQHVYQELVDHFKPYFGNIK